MRVGKRALQPPNQFRYQAALIVTGKCFADICESDGISYRFLRDILIGKSPLSERAETIMRKAVGEVGWQYALGRSDRLPCKVNGPAPRKRRRKKQQNGQG